jgi:hypothetical protein
VVLQGLRPFLCQQAKPFAIGETGADVDLKENWIKQPTIQSKAECANYISISWFEYLKRGVDFRLVEGDEEILEQTKAILGLSHLVLPLEVDCCFVLSRSLVNSGSAAGSGFAPDNSHASRSTPAVTSLSRSRIKETRVGGGHYIFFLLFFSRYLGQTSECQVDANLHQLALSRPYF